MTVACKECGHKQKSLKGAMAVNKVDAILARFPGPVTLRVSRLKMLGLLAGSLAFVVGSIFLIVFVKPRGRNSGNLRSDRTGRTSPDC